MATATDYNAVIRELWPDERIERHVADHSIVLASMKHDTDFAEVLKHVSTDYGNNQGRSADFAKAKTAAGSSKFEGFAISRYDNYGYGKIDGALLEATEFKHAAQVNAWERETKGSLDELMADLSRDAWNLYPNSGVLAQVSSSGGTTVTVTDFNDLRNIEEGQILVVGTTTGGAVRAGTMTVVSVDIEAGTFDVDALIAGISPSDYIFVDGDAANTGSNVKMSSIPGYIPYDTPGTGSAPGTYNNMDRTKRPERLAGHRHDGSGAGTIEAALRQTFSKVRKFSSRARPTLLAFNPDDLSTFEMQLGDKGTFTTYEVKMKTITVGTSAIRWRSPRGTAFAIEDAFVKKGYVWGLDMDTWEWHTLKDAPRILTYGHGDAMLERDPNADGIGIRSVARGDIVTTRPGNNFVCKIPQS